MIEADICSPATRRSALGGNMRALDWDSLRAHFAALRDFRQIHPGLNRDNGSQTLDDSFGPASARKKTFSKLGSRATKRSVGNFAHFSRKLGSRAGQTMGPETSQETGQRTGKKMG